MIKNNKTMIRGIEKRGCIIGDKNKIKNKNRHYTWKKKNSYVNPDPYAIFFIFVQLEGGLRVI